MQVASLEQVVELATRKLPHHGSSVQVNPHIRPLAVALCVQNDCVLVERGSDPATGQIFVRALGGEIEFGELAIDAVTREWREETGLALSGLQFRGVLENRFEYAGKQGHEHVFVFEAAPPPGAPEPGQKLRHFDPEGAEHVAFWVPIERLGRSDPPLYPTGCLDLLRGSGRL